MGRFSKLLAALLVLIAIVLGAYAWLLSQKTQRPVVASASTPINQSRPADTGVAVVVAARNLAPNVPVRAEDLKVSLMTELPVGGFSGIQTLIGQVPLSEISAGAPITRNALAASIASQLLAGERAMAIAVDELNGVGHRILPGDRVDVFVSLKPEQTPDGKGYLAQSRLLASSLRVLGYGAASLGDPPPDASNNENSETTAEAASRRSNSNANNSGGAPRPASSAVLAVPVDQVNVLAQAVQGGRLLLTLRNPADERIADASLFPKPASVLAVRADLNDEQKAALVDPVNLAYAGLDAPNLGGSIAAAKPARQPNRPTDTAAPRRTLEIIRGDQRSQTTY